MFNSCLVVSVINLISTLSAIAIYDTSNLQWPPLIMQFLIIHYLYWFFLIGFFSLFIYSIYLSILSISLSILSISLYILSIYVSTQYIYLSFYLFDLSISLSILSLNSYDAERKYSSLARVFSFVKYMGYQECSWLHSLCKSNNEC